MDDWQKAALAQVESVAYSTPQAEAWDVLRRVGDLVHHVLGHTEEQWAEHLNLCTICSGQWAPPGRA